MGPIRYIMGCRGPAGILPPGSPEADGRFLTASLEAWWNSLTSTIMRGLWAFSFASGIDPSLGSLTDGTASTGLRTANTGGTAISSIGSGSREASPLSRAKPLGRMRKAASLGCQRQPLLPVPRRNRDVCPDAAWPLSTDRALSCRYCVEY